MVKYISFTKSSLLNTISNWNTISMSMLVEMLTSALGAFVKKPKVKTLSCKLCNWVIEIPKSNFFLHKI